jgi:hemerythrin-like domain-containing protein
MTTTSPDPTTARPDTRDMVIVHRVFRREFRTTRELVCGVRPGDTARALVLAEHLADLVAALHHHHEGEDELLWPVLQQRATLDTALIHRMEAQHEELSGGLDRVERLLPEFRRSAEPGTRDALAAALHEVSTVLELHLGEEEERILPLCREHLTVAEWRALGERGSGGIPKDKLLVFLGLILEDADEEDRRHFMAEMPLMARLMWRLLGRRQYRAYVARLHAA